MTPVGMLVSVTPPRAFLRIRKIPMMPDEPDKDVHSKIIRKPTRTRSKSDRLERPVTFLRRTCVTVGGPDPPATVDPSFLARQALAAGPDKCAHVEPPRWFMEEIEKGGSPEEILRVLRQRVPHQSDLREAQLILNEIGRLRDGAKLIMHHLTPWLLSELEGGNR